MAKTKKIELEAYYPFSTKQVWQALSDKRAISEWLMDTDFEPTVGHKFQLRAKPMPGWRGYVDCVVLEVVPEKLLKISWQGGEEQSVMTVTWSITPEGEGTRLHFIHDGFDSTHGAFSALILRRMMMGPGWKRMHRDHLPRVIDQIRKNGVEAPFPEDLLKRKCNHFVQLGKPSYGK